MGPEDRRDSNYFPPTALLHDGLCATYFARLAAVSCFDGPGTHPADVQARGRIFHCYVPPQGLPSLVYWRGNGRNGVHGGRKQHERPRVRVPAVPGCHGRGGGRVRPISRRRQAFYFALSRPTFEFGRHAVTVCVEVEGLSQLPECLLGQVAVT